MIRQKQTPGVQRGSTERVRRGATCVEFAIVAPIVFLLFLGAIEMSQLNYLRHTAANAAYEGARRAIVPGGTGENAQQEAQRLLDAVDVGRGAQVDIDEQVDRVTVTVSIPTNLNSWGVSRFSRGFHVTRSSSLMRETSEAGR